MTKQKLTDLNFYITEAQDLIGRIDQLHTELKAYIDDITSIETKDDETLDLLDKIDFDSDDMNELGRDLEKLDKRRVEIASTWNEDDWIFDSEEIIDIDEDEETSSLFDEGEI